MSGMDRIKERILEDARQDADKTIEGAHSRANEVRAEIEAKAAAANAKATQAYQAKALEQKRRMISAVELDLRKKTLETKQDILDIAFAQCLKYLSEMPASQYRQILEQLLLQTIQTGEEEVVISSKDQDRLGADFIINVNSALTATGRKGSLKLSQEKGSFDSGFILKSGGVEINNTFAAILRTVREEIEPQLAKVLF